MDTIHTTNKIKRLFNYTRKISHRSDHPRIHIGCIAVYKNDIISVGYNQMKTHTIQKEYNLYRDPDYENCAGNIHAEINCLSKIDFGYYRNDKIVAYVYREDRNGIIACARPCGACMRYMNDCGIQHLYYTTKNGFTYERLGANDGGYVFNVCGI